MGFRLEYTPHGRASRDHCIEYLLYSVGGTGNYQAAKGFVQDLERVERSLKISADSSAICEEVSSPGKEYRKIHFKHYSYKLIYHIIGDTVFVDAIFHDLQDYQRLLP